MPRLGLGCMRLSTAADRDDAAAVALLHAAFDAGVDFLDSADAYCLDASETGHNERLIARALASWSGDRSRIVAATKGGLVRPEGRWVADGRARHLVAACGASRRALGVDRIALYQLHAPDPRPPPAPRVRALAALSAGLVGASASAASNKSSRRRRLARSTRSGRAERAPRRPSLWNGVAMRCLAERIPLVAYRRSAATTNARKLARDPVLVELAARTVRRPSDRARRLRSLSPLVLPIPRRRG